MLFGLVQQSGVLRSVPLVSRHSRFLASTPFSHTHNNTDSAKDTFGCLAAKYKQSNRRDDPSAPDNEESSNISRKFSKASQGTTATLMPNRGVSALSRGSTLRKWRQLREPQEVENQDVRSRWGDSQQDDAEEDYHLFVAGRLSSKHQGQAASPKKIYCKEESQEHVRELSSYNTSSDAGPPGESASREVFGSLSGQRDEPEGDEGDAREECYQEAKGERKHRPQYYGARMKKLCRERKLSEALKILDEEMPSVGAKPNDFCYQVLINACGRAGYTKKAFRLYNQMKERRLNIEPVAYTGLFNACANSPWPTTDGLQRATNLRAELKRKGYQCNQIVSHAMIKAFGRCGDIGTSFLVVDEMLEDGLNVTTETFSFLLQACITDKEAGFRHAIKVWRRMREMKLRPNIYTYNLLTRIVHECGAGDPSLTSLLLLDESGRPEPASEAHLDTNEHKQLPTPISVAVKEEALQDFHNTHTDATPANEGVASGRVESVNVQRQEDQISGCVLPNVLGKKMTAGNVVALGALDTPQDRLALLGGPSRMLKQMMKDRVNPDLRTFTQLLDSLPPDTQAEEAMLQSMKYVKVQPDTQFFNMLIKRRNFRGDIEDAQEVLTLMQQHHLIPDLITFGCLALGCQTLRTATQFLRDMDASQFRPSVEIMTNLVKNSLVKRDYGFTVAMMKEMQQRGTIPDDFLLRLLEQARVQARKTLLLSHKSSAEDTDQRRRSAEVFLVAYKEWLTASQVQMPEHPWAQYQ